MDAPHPHALAVAVARAYQTDPALARTVLTEYAHDLDANTMLRVLYASTQLLATADKRITTMCGRDEGDWLAHFGHAAARTD